MKTICVVAVAVLVLSAAPEARAAAPVREQPVNVALGAAVNYPFISSAGGTTYLQITLTTGDRRAVHRTPMNLAVVLDRSGSMADEGKMEFARAALMTLIDQLDSEDILSIVVYDDVVDVLRSACRVDDKARIKRLVSKIYPRNSTNLGGGMMAGLKQAEENVGREYVNRVILISDGLANRGITDPDELNRIARRYRARSISLTTMGVGLAYNENLMVGLAEHGGGNYYFIESPSSLASLMHSELHTLSRVIAQDATIELIPGRSVEVVDVIGGEYRAMDGKVVLHAGDLYANDRREWTVELRIPSGRGKQVVASGSLRYRETDAPLGPFAAFSASVQYTNDVSEVEKHRDLGAQAKADVAVSTRMVEKALEAIDDGRQADAEKELREARQMILASPAASAAGEAGETIQAQGAKLQAFADTLNENKDTIERAKKSIQYHNYRTQKNR
jgi:Ca-activated chloride channel family protein